MSNQYKNRVTKKEFDNMLPELSQYDRDMLWAILPTVTNTSLDIVDYSSECSMCGKPMPYRYCGMCVNCEMVWNS